MNRDIKSSLKPYLAFLGTISTDTTTTGTIIDTADFDGGFKFDFVCSAYTDGTYTPLVYEGDESNLSDKTEVADTNMIPQSGGEAAAALSAVTVEGAAIESLGIFGTKRYVRLDIVSTSTSSGATIVVTANGVSEIKKAA